MRSVISCLLCLKINRLNKHPHQEIVKIPFQEMESELMNLFLRYGFSDDKSNLLSTTITESTLRGVRSHGINRVPLMIEYINKGIIKVDAEAEKINEFGSMERWDGHQGAGIINAIKCTDRAIHLAKSYGMGMLALRNTNHWLRGGTYGWQAANAGCISILFTNTKPNMPPWGGKDSRIGNNPLVISIPREEGHIVLDMAMSQFSFGKINEYRLVGKNMPFYGGYDEDGNLSDDPGKILKKERGLPIGYWKGSALSMVLDMLATLLSAGNSTFRIGQKDEETSISQIFLCIDPEVFGDRELQNKITTEIIDYTQNAEPLQQNGKVYYPGEQSALTRTLNLKEGIPVNLSIWNWIKNL